MSETAFWGSNIIGNIAADGGGRSHAGSSNETLAAQRCAVSLAHDYLIQMGGAERVVASLHRAFPEAPIFVSATDYAHLLEDFEGAAIYNTWMQDIPGISRRFKSLFPIYPFAFQSFGALDADAVIVSTSAYATSLRFTPRTRVFCYCHTPPRFLWQAESYLENEIRNRAIKLAVRALIPAFRRWDYHCAQRVDHFIANSRCVQERIRRCYHREATIIYPPVNVDRFAVSEPQKGYYLILSRLVAYKGLDRAVRAFSESGQRLVVVGDGPDRKRLEAMARPNVEFRGRASEAEVKACLEGCYALVFPGLEDFGIAPVEAQACGKPVLAYGAGGALETVLDGVTGMFFHEPTPEAIVNALPRFESIPWDAARIRANAERFSEAKFIAAIEEFVEQQVKGGNA